MHGFDYSVPLFVTRVRGTHIVVTPDIVSEVLCVSRVEHPNYPGCECLRTVSKGELISSFCVRPSDWGDRQFTSCTAFAKGPRFLNMVMTFVLHLLSHYNSITESRARFLLSLLEHIIIDFPSHFILSIIDVYRDTTTRDKLIFPLAITRILRHFSVPFPVSDHFHVMCAINAATVKWSKAQLCSRRFRTAAPPTSSTPSTSAPSSFLGGVTLEDIMAQLVRMDACLDTLNDELCHVNTYIGCIVRRQAAMGGYAAASSPSPPASEDEDDDGDDDEDDAASSSNTDKMPT